MLKILESDPCEYLRQAGKVCLFDCPYMKLNKIKLLSFIKFNRLLDVLLKIVRSKSEPSVHKCVIVSQRHYNPQL